jgi:nucleotide-binding universal stress UspA family protein
VRLPVVVVGPSCPAGWIGGGGPVVGCLTEGAAADSGTNAAVVAATRRWARVLGREARLATVVTTGAQEADRVPGVEVLCSRHPAATIQAFATHHQAALLVLGAHRGGAAGGSCHVMRPLIAGAPCPVFVPSDDVTWDAPD